VRSAELDEPADRQGVPEKGVKKSAGRGYKDEKLLRQREKMGGIHFEVPRALTRRPPQKRKPGYREGSGENCRPGGVRPVEKRGVREKRHRKRGRTTQRKKKTLASDAESRGCGEKIKKGERAELINRSGASL